MADKPDVDLERALRVLVSQHPMAGSNPDAPVEKICYCGWRGIGLLAHTEHQREEDAKRLAAEFRAVRLEEAKWWNAKLFAVSKCDRETWDRLEKLEAK